MPVQPKLKSQTHREGLVDHASGEVTRGLDLGMHTTITWDKTKQIPWPKTTDETAQENEAKVRLEQPPKPMMRQVAANNQAATAYWREKYHPKKYFCRIY